MAGPLNAPSPRAIRILCIDDHELVRDGIAFVVGGAPGMAVVASAATGEEGLALFDTVRPDITLLDLELPGISGVDVIKAIRGRQPDARIIVLTIHHDIESIYQALQVGATTYLLKDTLSRDLIRIIGDVHAGAPPVLAELVASGLAERAEMPAVTPREIEIIELIAGGLSNKEVAARLGISDQTVHAHVRNVCQKFAVSDRTAVVTAAMRRGLLRIV